MLNTGEILEKYLRGRMSMTDLANILGISPQYISSVVKNVKRPSKNFLDKFYMIFDVLDEDKKNIENYEEFRRLPENFQKEYLDLKIRENINLDDKPEITKVPLKAIVESGLGNLNSLEKEEYINTTKAEYINDESFFIKIYSNELEPEFKNKDLVLIDPKSCADFYLLNNKLCILEYNEEIFLKKIEYLKEIIILRCVSEKLNPIIITESNIDKLKCVGKVRQIIRYIE